MIYRYDCVYKIENKINTYDIKLEDTYRRVPSINLAKKPFAKKLSNNLKPTLPPFPQNLKQLSLILRTLLIPFLPLNNILHLKPTSRALSLPGQTHLMKGMATHKMDGGETETVLALNAIVGQEGFGAGF